MEQIIRPITKAWMEKIHKAADHKQEEFQQDAEECKRFFDGPYDWLYTGRFSTKSGSFGLGGDDIPRPTFRMTTNKVAELVQLYGPALYHRNPHRQVSMREMNPLPVDILSGGDPEMAQIISQQAQMLKRTREVRAELFEDTLNYTPNELDLQQHSREAIDEALIIGMGLLWHEVYQPPGSPYKFVGSFYDTTDNLMVDPDMESIRHAKWIARRRVMPKWEVEKRFGLRPGSLKGNLESVTMQGTAAAHDENYFRQRGDTNDLFTFWEVYSRMGMGHRLHGTLSAAMEASAPILDQFGDHIYLAISEEEPYPLNLPKEVVEGGDMEDAFMRLQWPTPFWADPTDPWPFSHLAFHERPRKVWPMSHVKPALGELKFINWVASFLADKVKNTSRDFVAILKSASEDLKTRLLSGRDLSLLEFEKHDGQRIDQLIQFLQHPPFNKDILEVWREMKHEFEMRTGISELFQGYSGRQMRSASEAQLKSDQLRIRPDDMAQKVENWATKGARKEAIACYWHYTPEDVKPQLGEERAMLWQQFIQGAPLHEVVHELDYRIEAGSIRKPNRDRDIQNATNSVQVLLPILMQTAQMNGDITPISNIVEMWAKANDLPKEKFIIQPPPPPQPDPAQQQEAEMAAQEHQMEMEKKEAETQKSQLEIQMDAMRHSMEMDQDAEEHDQEMFQDQQKHLMEMLQARQKGQQDLELARQKAAAQVSATRNKPSPGGNGNGS